MIVIADTTPLNYLVLIERVGILPRLYGPFLIPPAVWQEFQRPETPEAVRAWLAERHELTVDDFERIEISLRGNQAPQKGKKQYGVKKARGNMGHAR